MGYRYIGSKTKLNYEIVAEIQRLAPVNGHIVDLMTGTASVALALRKAHFNVTAVDVMTFSYHHARVVLMLDEAPMFEGAAEFIARYAPNAPSGASNYECMLIGLNQIPSRREYFWNEFSRQGKPEGATKPRNYFSAENAQKIDALRHEIKILHQKGQITDIEHSLLIHDLIMATNDIANISGTYGHYLSELIGRATQPILLYPTKFDNKGNISGHTVIRGYAEEVSKSIKADLCYIDPPYMKRQYAANYHILETLAREDMPEAIGESGLRPWRDQYSNFCTKTKIRGAFDQIFSDMDCPDFLVSYSEDGLLSLDQLTELFARFGTVSTKKIEYKRFKSNKSKLDSKITEYLIHIRINQRRAASGLSRPAEVRSTAGTQRSLQPQGSQLALPGDF